MFGLRHIFAAAILVVTALPLATVGAGNPVYAAAGADDLVAAADPKLVTDIQRRLSALGLYRAPLDGRVTPATAAAIRTYQRSAGLKVDGRPSRALLAHLNSAEAQGNRLVERLGKVRDAQIAAARRALENHAPASDIVAGAPALEGRAGTTNAAACFAAPTPACLLDEAQRSAVAVKKAEFRDWALGEIAAVQAAAGDAAAALAAATALSDPRLVIVALGRIAEAQATAGDDAGARITAHAIPGSVARAEALIAVAKAQIVRGEKVAAGDTVYDVVSELVVIFEPTQLASLYGAVAGLQARLGDTEGALASLDRALDAAQAAASAGGRDQALGLIAVAMAEIGRIAHALDIVATIKEPRFRTSTLIVVAAAQAEAGDYDRARATIAAIADARYRVVGLEKLARAQARAGARPAALATLARARAVSDGLDYSYARAFGLSLVARAQAALDAPAETRRSIALIDDAALRARALWSLADAEARLGDGAAAARSEARALGAADQIEDPLDRVWLLCEIAVERSRVTGAGTAQSVFDRALAQTKALDTPWLRARALSRLASGLVAMRQAAAP